MYEKINTYITSDTYILLVCAYIAKQFRRLVQEHERKKCNVTANVVGRHTLQNKSKEIMKELSKEVYRRARTIIRKEEQSICTKSTYNTCAYVSRREQKRMLHKLQGMSTEELMQEHYLQQKKRAFTIGTQIERNAFEIGKGLRTKKKARNTCYREEAGTCETYTSVRKFAASQEFVEKRGTSVRRYTLTSYTNVVCKSRNLY